MLTSVRAAVLCLQKWLNWIVLITLHSLLGDPIDLKSNTFGVRIFNYDVETYTSQQDIADH